MRTSETTERWLIAARTGLGPVHLSVTDGGRALRFGEDRQSCRHRNTDKVGEPPHPDEDGFGSVDPLRHLLHHTYTVT